MVVKTDVFENDGVSRLIHIYGYDGFAVYLYTAQMILRSKGDGVHPFAAATRAEEKLKHGITACIAKSIIADAASLGLLNQIDGNLHLSESSPILME